MLYSEEIYEAKPCEVKAQGRDGRVLEVMLEHFYTQNRKFSRLVPLTTKGFLHWAFRRPVSFLKHDRLFQEQRENGDLEQWATNDLEITRDTWKRLALSCWSIETYYRGLKSCCRIEKAQVRSPLDRKTICYWHCVPFYGWNFSVSKREPVGTKPKYNLFAMLSKLQDKSNVTI